MDRPYRPAGVTTFRGVSRAAFRERRAAATEIVGSRPLGEQVFGRSVDGRVGEFEAGFEQPSWYASATCLLPDYEDIDPYAVATLEFGITYERALLHWFDQLPPQIKARVENDPER